MRKDVKFIFAIGAILLAALILYVFVVPAGDKKGQPIAGTTPDTTGTGTSSETTGTTGSSPVIGGAPSTQPSWASVTSTTTQPTGGIVSSTTQPSSGSSSIAIGGATTQPTGSGYASGNDPFRSSYPSATTTQPTGTTGSESTSGGGVAMSGTGSADGKNVDWGRLLQTGQYSATHDSTGGSTGSTPSSSGSSYASNVGSRNGTASLFGGSSGSSSTGTGSTSGGFGGSSGATAGGQRTHVVKAGETLTSIAQAEYGDGSQYNKILAANPKVDPRRIKVGQSLIIPDASSAAATPSAVTAGGTGSSSTSGSTGMSGTTGGIEVGNGKAKPSVEKPTSGKTYTVQAGDSLQRIAAKVYGSSDKWEKIYQANKSKIGSNPQHIRAGQVLQIPADNAKTATTR